MPEEVKRPDPGMVGTGMANYAARLAELRRKQKDAALRDDWAAADRYEAQIRQLEHERATAAQGGGK